MPYETIEDLPEPVRAHLPKHAQEIYKTSFNNAHETYRSRKKRQNPKESLEVICHKVAWAAVKKKYKKDKGGNWVEK